MPRPLAHAAAPRVSYPSVDEWLSSGPQALRRLLESARTTAIVGLATALAACHGGESAAPHPTSLTPTPIVPPPPTAAPPAPLVPSAPPVPPVVSGEEALPHPGDPCPDHDDGVVVTQDAAAQLAPEQRAHLHPLSGHATIGGIGGSGHYYMGGGVGIGTLQRNALQPRVVDRPAVVHGTLSQDVVHRVVRRHVNEARFCFERELQANPELAGDVTVRFVVGTTGTVQTSVVVLTTIANAAVEGCLVQSTRRWTFPQPPGGGVVVVDQRWSFSNGD